MDTFSTFLSSRIVADAAVFLIAFAASLFCFGFIKDMLENAEFTELNYRKERIPIGMGILFAVLAPLTAITVSAITGEITAESSVFAAAVLMMGFAGMIDDFLGNKNDKGFKGHIKALLRGRLTTGGFKAVLGFITAFIVSIFISSFSEQRHITDIILNTFLIALFTNIINLFDLRPGRACKAYLLFLIIINIFSARTEIPYLSLASAGIVLGYIRKDLKAEVMMGDTGSNALGASLGVIAAIVCPYYVKLGMAFVLVGLHIVSEFYSFSKIIEKSRILSFFDRLGRGL